MLCAQQAMFDLVGLTHTGSSHLIVIGFVIDLPPYFAVTFAVPGAAALLIISKVTLLVPAVMTTFVGTTMPG